MLFLSGWTSKKDAGGWEGGFGQPPAIEEWKRVGMRYPLHMIKFNMPQSGMSSTLPWPYGSHGFQTLEDAADSFQDNFMPFLADLHEIRTILDLQSVGYFHQTALGKLDPLIAL